MEWNTIRFTNTDNSVFVGRFDGEDYPIQPKEVRYFPSFLSEHFFKHLTEKLFKDISGIEKGLKISEFQEKVRKQILGDEIMTKVIEKPMTTKDKILTHENKVKEILAEEEKQKKAQEIEAMKIIEEQPK